MDSHTIVLLGLRLVNPLNSRQHWRTVAERSKRERDTAYWSVRSSRKEMLPWPMRVTLTRCGPRALDSDNLAASAKHVRDGVAQFVGVDDGDPGYEWVYAQEKQKTYGVRITIEPRMGTT